MKRYSVQPRDRIFVKGYKILFFTKNLGKVKIWVEILVKI